MLEIERMLDDEHRTVEKMRETFATLRRIATEGTLKSVFWQGMECGQQREYHSAFMELYLNRILGPVREQVSEDDLSGLSDETLQEVRQKLRLVR